jgi:hypothetical protein
LCCSYNCVVWNVKSAFLLTQTLQLCNGHGTTVLRSGDANEEANKLTYLQLLALTRKLLVAIVPVSMADSVLHQKLKSALSRSLLDPSVITLFPKLHTDLLQYVKVRHQSVYSVCSKLISVLVSADICTDVLIIEAAVPGPGSTFQCVVNDVTVQVCS